MAYFSTFNVCPCKNNINEVCNIDLYIVDKMLHGLGHIIGLPLVSLIIQELRNVVTQGKSFMFPHLFTLIFRALNIDVDREEVIKTTSSDILSIVTLRNLKY